MESNTEENVTQPDLITEGHVKAALEVDKGNAVQITSWEIHDFTKKGDNLGSYVTSVKVKFSSLGKEQSVSYIVKVNPGVQVDGFDVFTKNLFAKEGGFYGDILHKLNSALDAAGQHPLRTPKCYLVVKEAEKEMVWLEDLRPKGYKMLDRQRGIDYNHGLLITKELARLHSASLLLQKEEEKDLVQRYEYLKVNICDIAGEGNNLIKGFFEKASENSIALLNHVGGYDKAVEWITERVNSCMDIIGQMTKRTPPFDVLCHGDVWKNNILFRYNDEGDPVELMLLDLQGARVGSLSSDLNYCFFTSMKSDVRRTSMNMFLATYFETFEEILGAGDMTMPFTLEELKVEYRNKHPFGLYTAMVITPSLMIDGSDFPDAEEYFAGSDNNREVDIIKKAFDNLDANSDLPQMFLSIFEDMEAAGVFD